MERQTPSELENGLVARWWRPFECWTGEKVNLISLTGFEVTTVGRMSSDR